MKRRLFISLLSITVIFGVMIIRMFWIQIVGTHHFATHKVNLVQKSVEQRRHILMLDDGRAHFYDRHMQPLTGQKIEALAIFPMHHDDRGSREAVYELAATLGVTGERFMAYLDGLDSPELWQGGWLKQSTPVALTEEQSQAIKRMALSGVQVVPYQLRYVQPYLASHLLGFVAQNSQRLSDKYIEKLQKGTLSTRSLIGVAGLELSLDPYLLGSSTSSLTLFTDGRLKPLAGLNIRHNDQRQLNRPLKVVTMLDKVIQEKIEMIIDEANVTHGAVVVMDVDNADVLAMLSRPQFNPYDVQPQATDWGNKALKAYTPGSIFKTVVAAAALEGRYVKANERFFCDGSLGQYGLSCWKQGGHGQISFEEAYVQSCNVAFAQVMARIPSSALERTALKLGLTQRIGWSGPFARSQTFISQFAAEEAGQIFADDQLKVDGGARAQTALGQRDVLLTPLQAVNMIVTLLHDGQLTSPRVVKDIRFADNRLYGTFAKRTLIARKNGISSHTSRTLLHWMEHVVKEGTGKTLNDDSQYLAGKTGTAQVLVQGEELQNQWFIGYGPVQKPKYAVAVIVQNNLSSHQATELFGKIMDVLL